MKDDPEFNVNFATLIQTYPCIYDYTHADYSKRHIQDRAWALISQELSESVGDCKDRWKNLRSCYSRYLKSLKGSKHKRPYYLAETLNFLLPFSKSRKLKGKIEELDLQIPSPEDVQTQDSIQTLGSIQNHGSIQMQDSCTRIDGTRIDIEEDAQDSFQEDEELSTGVSLQEENSVKPTFYRKRAAKKVYIKCKAKERKPDNPDLDFLRSLLPDMEEMNSDQKRRFKIGVLKLAGNILNGYMPAPSIIQDQMQSSATYVERTPDITLGTIKSENYL